MIYILVIYVCNHYAKGGSTIIPLMKRNDGGVICEIKTKILHLSNSNPL